VPTEAPPTPTAIWLEGALLLLTAPWLLFPERFPLVTAVALALLALSWLWPLLRRRPPLPATPFNLALLVWALALLGGVLVSADPDLTLPKATGLLLGFAAWRYLARCAPHPRPRALGAAAFVLAGLGFTLLGFLNADWLAKAPSQVGFAQAVLKAIPLPPLPETGADAVHPNQIAGTITLYWPLLLALLLGAPLRRPVRLGLGLLVLLIGAMLLLTQSRSGWLGGFASGAALLTLWATLLPAPRRRRALGLLLAGGLAVVILALILIGPQRLPDLGEAPPPATAVGSLATLNYRALVWPWALTAVQDFPYTGVGLGAFRRVAQRLYPLAVPPGADIAHAHNILLQVALDVGLPGLVAYAALLLLAASVGWQAARWDARQRPLALGLLAGLVGLHVYGLTDALAPGAKPGLLFWMALGLLAALRPPHSGKID
jgi:putative inorganic carbon (hco3(-)) transporter